MPAIVIYSKPACPYCEMAKRLLTEKGQTWIGIDVEAEPVEWAIDVMPGRDGSP